MWEPRLVQGMAVDAAILVDCCSSRITPAQLRIGRVKCQLALQLFRSPAIVGIVERDPLPARGGNRSVAQPRAMPDVLAAHDLYPRVRERFQPRHAVIGRAIID